MHTSHNKNEPTAGNNLQYIMDATAIGIMVIGRDDGIIRFANNRASLDFGKSLSELLGSHYRQVFWPPFTPVYDRLAAKCEDGFTHSAIYYWPDMSLWEQVYARTVVYERSPCILISVTNITEIASTEFNFSNVTYFDSLLRLPNGQRLEDDINELASVDTVALIYISLERFAEINNIYGWDNGNYLLKQIRDWFVSSESHRAQLYRVENGFAILGRNIPLADAEDRAKEIIRRFDRPWSLIAGGNTLSVFCSIKVGIIHGKYVKNEMRNLLMRTVQTVCNDHGYAIYDEQADQKAKDVLQLRDELINCIHDDMKGFDIHYQPIIHTTSQQWIGVEALCRWASPGGQLSPATIDVVHIIEQLGLIGHLDGWVCKTAVNRCSTLGLHNACFMLDVNFSQTQRVNPGVIDRILATLSDNDFPPHKLNIEITESAKMDFGEASLHGLIRLQEAGVMLSLDDFGTGYSTFEKLITIPCKILKIEKMFIDSITDDAYRKYLLRMMVDLAHHLDMALVAEGVETEAQFELMQAYGVDYVQGYFFSKPLNLEQLKAETWRFVPER